MQEVDLEKEVKCLITFAENSLHHDVLESCNTIIKILEEVREIAVANIAKETEISKAVGEIENINI